MRPTPEGVGNSRRNGASGWRRSRFNEAHARRRGKWALLGGETIHELRASMRPTPEGVGNRVWRFVG